MFWIPVLAISLFFIQYLLAKFWSRYTCIYITQGILHVVLATIRLRTSKALPIFSFGKYFSRVLYLLSHDMIVLRFEGTYIRVLTINSQVFSRNSVPF